VVGGQVWIIPAMPTHAIRPIDQLTTDWEAIEHSGESRDAVRALGDAEPEVASLGAHDLGELIGALRKARGTTARDRAARAVAAMVRSQHVHRLIPRAILQAILPGLVNVARRLAWGRGGDWDDGGAFFADLVTTAWEVIVDWSGQDRDFAVLDLLSAVRCRARRQLLHQRSARDRVLLGLEPDDAPLARPANGGTDLDLLARALDELAEGGFDRADAAVLYANRVLGMSMAELVRLTGRPRKQLQAGHDRAREALCA
jgi:hypothetical protein